MPSAQHAHATTELADEGRRASQEPARRAPVADEMHVLRTGTAVRLLTALLPLSDRGRAAPFSDSLTFLDLTSSPTMKIQLPLIALALVVSQTGAVLPPGYEDVMWCPEGYCDRPVDQNGMSGPARIFHECYDPSSQSVVDEVWTGAKTDTVAPANWQADPPPCSDEETLPPPSDSLVGVAAPGQHVLYERAVASDLASYPEAPLRIRSTFPVTVQRYTTDFRLSHPLDTGDGVILVTSDCASGATTATPAVTVQRGSATVAPGDRDAAPSRSRFLAPSSYEAAWHEAGHRLYPAGDLSEEELALARSEKEPAPPEEPAPAPPLSPHAAGGAASAACQTRDACDARRAAAGIASPLAVGAYPIKGCFTKKTKKGVAIAYWGTGGAPDERARAPLSGAKERLWCEDPPTLPGSSYCTWAPNKPCYKSGWPECCAEEGGRDCPSEPPGCDVSALPAEPPGTCAADAECAARVRSRAPRGDSTAVGLCGCYAASRSHPFDECEGREDAECRSARCADSCAGVEAYCKRKRCALRKEDAAAPASTKRACLTQAQCEERRAAADIAPPLEVGDYPTKGCFTKKGRAYWGTGGAEDTVAAAALPGVRERLWCGTVRPGDDCEVGPAASPLRSCDGAGAFCELRTGVCNNKSGIHEGICREVPERCPLDVRPVCGCNGQTYANECQAHADGVSLSRKGACGNAELEVQLMPGDNCQVGPASSTLRSCSGGSRKAHCRLRMGLCNNKSGIYEGICQVLPEMCTLDVRPVCGCDGLTYNNECKAHAAGVNVASKGACDRTPVKMVACLTKRECDARRKELGIKTLNASADHPSKGCFVKNGYAYWSPGTKSAMTEEDLPGQRERLWCSEADGSQLSLQQAEVAAAVQAREASSAAAFPRGLLLSSLLRYVAPSAMGGGALPRDGRVLDTCSYNVEILLTGCNDDSPANIEISAPAARVIDSWVKNEDTDIYAVHEVYVEGGTGYYSKDYKRTATLTFPEDQAVSVASSVEDDFAVVPPWQEYQCQRVVPGRPFVGSDGRGLLAPHCSGTQCEGHVASWSDGTTTRTPLVGNTTSDDNLGGEWTRNALGEHASVASFAAFSITLMSNLAPSDLVEDALKAALDEMRHAKVSFDIASKLVGKQLGPGPLPPSSHEFRSDMGALAVAVAREGCVDETLSALALAAECELIDGVLENGSARVAKYHDVADEVLIWIKNELRTIAMDEATHSALAWRTLRWVCSIDAEACEAAKQHALNESSLVTAFQHRFGRDFEGRPELLERMLTAWSRIYTNSHLLGFQGVESDCVAGDLNEVSDQHSGSQSLLSLLVENILRGSHM